MTHPVPALAAGDPRAVALAAAIQRGETQTLRALLDATPALAAARIVDDRGVERTLLHVAADWPGHFPSAAASVALLIAAGAAVNAPVDHRGQGGAPETALHWAASSDDVAVLDALLDGGADIEAPGGIFTNGSAMSDAIVFAQYKAARRLLERGASTTLWQAAALGLTDRVLALCNASPSPAPREITNAFWHACRAGQRETASLLLGRGAELNWIGYDHKTPLAAAHDSGNRDVIAWLMSSGAQMPGAAAVSSIDSASRKPL